MKYFLQPFKLVSNAAFGVTHLTEAPLPPAAPATRKAPRRVRRAPRV